jgi:hypothetical protein
MNKKKNLLNIFTQDVTYNYHLVKTEEPNGHLIYLIKNGSDINIETLEFSTTRIAEELVSECEVDMEKIAPAIFFTETTNTDELKYKLNDKLSETSEFSSFIETIKDEYRILEVKDSLLFKKDPKAYEDSKKKEYEEHQKELWDKMVDQLNDKKKKREDTLLAYNNDLIKLLKEYFESIIEYEKKDFDFSAELEKIVGNLIDEETWIKVNDTPFVCRIEVISLEQDKMNVFLTNNNEHSYTATLRFDKTKLITENIIRINKEDSLPNCMNDYDVLSQLYDVDITNVKDWEYKNDTDRFKYTIDYLTPIFKTEKDKKEKELVEKILKEEEELEATENNEKKEEEINNSNNMKNNKKTKKTADNYMFDVYLPDDVEEMNPPSVCLVEMNFWNKNKCLDDSLGSYNLPKNIIKLLDNAGVFGKSELMESVWEVVDTTRTKQDIIDSMINEGFIYNPNIF